MREDITQRGHRRARPLLLGDYGRSRTLEVADGARLVVSCMARVGLNAVACERQRL